MSHNTENIEAALCAYVDGELDAKERVEIEKHLEANPQHRQLLLELMTWPPLATIHPVPFPVTVDPETCRSAVADCASSPRPLLAMVVFETETAEKLSARMPTVVLLATMLL